MGNFTLRKKVEKSSSKDSPKQLVVYNAIKNSTQEKNAISITSFSLVRKFHAKKTNYLAYEKKRLLVKLSLRVIPEAKIRNHYPIPLTAENGYLALFPFSQGLV